jgi:hypothetical protein
VSFDVQFLSTDNKSSSQTSVPKSIVSPFTVQQYVAHSLNFHSVGRELEA